MCYKKFNETRKYTRGLRKRKTSGQSMVEYILIIGLIALLVYAAVNKLGNNVNTGFSNAASKVNSALSEGT